MSEHIHGAGCEGCMAQWREGIEAGRAQERARLDAPQSSCTHPLGWRYISGEREFCWSCEYAMSAARIAELEAALAGERAASARIRERKIIRMKSDAARAEHYHCNECSWTWDVGSPERHAGSCPFAPLGLAPGWEYKPSRLEADRDALAGKLAALREALSESERLAVVLIGRFHAACEGRHFEGRTCDYCLVDDILRTVRVALVPRPQVEQIALDAPAGEGPDKPSVFSRPECTFKYCPTRDICEPAGKCSHPYDDTPMGWPSSGHHDPKPDAGEGR